MNKTVTIKHADMPKALFNIVNPIMKFLLRSPLHGLVDDNLIMLRWRGHKSGKEYQTPVGYTREGSTLIVYTFSGWQANFRTPHPVEVKLKGEWHTGTGHMEDDPRAAAEFIKRTVAKDGPGNYRRFRMEVEGPREPTVEELIPEVEKRDMALIMIELNNP